MTPAAAVFAAEPRPETQQPLVDAYVALWQHTPAELPPLGAEVSRLRQILNGRSTCRLIDDVTRRVLTYPSHAPAQVGWREAMRQRILVWGERCCDWPPGYRQLVLGEAFYETAAAFARAARQFDPTLPLEDLGQALRNVWVANSLQLSVGSTVQFTPALFAYSMLYPLTDNRLDAPGVPAAAKATFNERFGRRLRGGRLQPADRAEARIWTLVEIIETEFPRTKHPDVWSSVIAIYRAQVASVRQQSGVLSDVELLELTVAKGGASVLADLHLAGAAAESSAIEFAFGYGVFLQMLDDLQDVAPDLAAGHETLFTRAAREGDLDASTARLARFIDAVLERGASPAAPADCLDLIRRNCRALLVGVIAREPHRFSRRLRRRVERHWPVTLGAMRRLQQRAMQRTGDARRQLRERLGVTSPLEWLLGVPVP